MLLIDQIVLNHLQYRLISYTIIAFSFSQAALP